jgi:glycosyltransferase involved in cell wall biosynthesis
MKKVLYFEDGQGFGGSLISLSELLDGLKASGCIDPFVLVSVDNDISNEVFHAHRHAPFRRLATYQTRFRLLDWLSRSRLPDPIRRITLKFYLLGHIASEFFDSIRLFYIIRRERVDIVHSNNGWVEAVVRSSRWARRPCVLHFRGFPGTEIASKPLISRSGKRIHLIAISNAVRNRLEASGTTLAPISVVYNPIHLIKYDVREGDRPIIRQKYSFAEEHLVVSMFGRITPWKGQLEFLRAMAMIAKKIPSLRIMMVGDESDAYVSEYSKAIQGIIDSPQLRGRVTLAGYQIKPAGYYWASDIVVHNSQEPEPFGRVVAEAMACKRAVIAVKEGGPAEIVTHGFDGLLVTPRDESALAQAVEFLANSPDTRVMLGGNARHTVETRFSHQVIATQILQVYEKLCGKN